MRKSDTGTAPAWIALAIADMVFFTLSTCFCSSCTRKIYVPVERTERHTDTLYRAMWHTDTVIDRDTIKTFVRQDSAVTEIIRWRWRVRERHDTVHRTDTDSVYVEKPYPVEVVKEVDKPLSWWQKTLMWIGAGIITCVLFALGKRLYLKFR